MTKLGKFFIAFTLIALFSSCGYTPIFSKKTVNFSIENIEFLGKVNRNVCPVRIKAGNVSLGKI